MAKYDFVKPSLFHGRSPPYPSSESSAPDLLVQQSVEHKAMPAPSSPRPVSRTQVISHPKRKLDEGPALNATMQTSSVSNAGLKATIDESPRKRARSPSSFSIASSSARSTTGTGPMLPIPLPSKRFKDPSAPRALLLPVDQLPVYPLPALPPIKDEGVLKMVFTHTSMFQNTKGRFEDDSGHYEKLEHVGDSILGMLVTTWLHKVKPKLSCGTATKLKAHLVSNNTLSHLSGLYNLPQRLVGDPNMLPTLRAQTDVRAALMEAYIAGLYVSYPDEETDTVGLPMIGAWLREMYDPMFDFFFKHMKSEYNRHQMILASSVGSAGEEELRRIDEAAQGMANLLIAYCQRNAREVRWEESRLEANLGTIWTMRCFVDKADLGSATRSSKKLAKNASAWEAAKKLGLTDDGVTA